MNLGFTGTQTGMTSHQRSLVRQILESKRPDCVHHGGCVGADSDFHEIVRSLFTSEQCQIHIYPSNIKGKQGRLDGDVVYSEREPLSRNSIIVWHSDELIACPKETTEQVQSGTWATIRRARKRRIPIHIFYPE